MAPRSIDGATMKKIGEILTLLEYVLGGFTKTSLQKIIENGGEFKKKFRQFVLEFGGEEVPAESVEPTPATVTEKPLGEADVAYDRQTWRLAWRWGLMFTVLTAVFWGVWYFYADPRLPIVDQFPIDSTRRGITYIHLPFFVPRWLDILFVPIWVSGIIILMRSIWIQNRVAFSHFQWALVFGFLYGAIAGIFSVGIVAGSFVGIIFSALVSSIASDQFSGKWETRLFFDLLFAGGIGLAAGYSLKFGFGLGFAVMVANWIMAIFYIASFIGLVLFISFVSHINELRLAKLWQRIGQWLAGQ